MEVIKCPVCGNEKCKEVSDDKYICLACDNVFLIHNLSKEFKETDQHLSEVHEDLKQTLKAGLGKGEEEQIKEKLENASKMLELGEYELAFDKYEEIAKEHPKLSEAWIGKYRAMTHNYTAYDKYATFLCGGYCSGDDDEDTTHFQGYKDVRNALECTDCNEEKIKTEVYDFLKKCYEYAQEDLVSVDMALDEKSDQYNADENYRKKMATIYSILEVVKYLAPAIVVAGVVIFLIINWIQNGGFLDIVLSVLLGIIGVKVVIKLLKWGVPNAKEWVEAYSSTSGKYADVLEKIVYDRRFLFNIVKNYSILSEDIEDKDTFMRKYLSDDAYRDLCTGEEEISDADLDFVLEKLAVMRDKLQTEESE